MNTFGVYTVRRADDLYRLERELCAALRRFIGEPVTPGNLAEMQAIAQRWLKSNSNVLGNYFQYAVTVERGVVTIDLVRLEQDSTAKAIYEAYKMLVAERCNVG